MILILEAVCLWNSSENRKGVASNQLKSSRSLLAQPLTPYWRYRNWIIILDKRVGMPIARQKRKQSWGSECKYGFLGVISSLLTLFICCRFTVGVIRRERRWVGISVFRKNGLVMSEQMSMCWIGRGSGTRTQGGKRGEPGRRGPARSWGFVY